MNTAVWSGPLAEEQRRLHQRAAAEYEALFGLYVKGRLDEAEFRRRRAFYGVHSRPQPGRVMMRVKVPLGRLSAEHLRCAADLARRFTPTQSFYITPRQNLQFYEVPLEDSPAFARTAVDGGYGLAGAGGRNPRNLTLPAGAGLGPEEAFDPTWAAALLLLRLESDEALRNLPGKLKVGFWRSLHDEESEPGNDITIIPVRRRVGTRLRRGFRLLLGGGLGADPRVEALWKGFVPPEDLYAHLRAVILHFKAAGDARKPYNRLRHLVRGEGWPEFQRAVELLLRGQPRDRAATFHHRLPLYRPLEPSQGCVVKAQPLAGLLGAAQAEALAVLAGGLGDGLLRLSMRQQLWLAGVPEARLHEAHQTLADLDLAGPYLGHISACPGKRVCGHAGIETDTVSRLALNALHQSLGDQEAVATRGLKLGISGCPNGCGHHRSADLGLEGLRRRLNGTLVPFVRVYGRRPGADTPGLAEPVGALPQSSLPLLLQRLVADFRRGQAPDLASFLRQSAGWESLLRHLGELAPPGSRPGEDRDEGEGS